MVKLSLFIALILSIVAVAHAQHFSRIEKYKSETVLISVEGLTPDHIRGTGVLLDETHVLTCFHMLRAPTDELTVYTYPAGRYVTARPETVDQNDDLAILVLDSSVTVTQKPVFAKEIVDGERVTVVGNALGSMEWLVKAGVVSGTEKNFVISDVRVNHGDSGGPWFNDDGEIVAISDWIKFDENNPGASGGISSIYINRFFASIAAQKKLMEMMEKLLTK